MILSTKINEFNAKFKNGSKWKIGTIIEKLQEKNYRIEDGEILHLTPKNNFTPGPGTEKNKEKKEKDILEKNRISR